MHGLCWKGWLRTMHPSPLDDGATFAAGGPCGGEEYASSGTDAYDTFRITRPSGGCDTILVAGPGLEPGTS